MIHSFNTKIAEKLGIEKAIIIQNLAYWLQKNMANNQHCHECKYYTYNSYEAFAELFPYMKLNTIKRVLRELEEEGYISSRNDLNESSWDKTKWYTIEDNDGWLYSLLFDNQKNNHREEEKQPSLIGSNINTDNKHKYKKINKKEIENDFATFWKAYPKKVGKKDALKAFTKVYKELPPLNELLEIIEKNKRSKNWTKNGGEFIPHPTTWLNGRRWEDEVVIETRSVSSNEEIIMRAMRGQNQDFLEGEVI